MFNKIIIRQHRKAFSSELIDLSFLVETLLFYQSITLIADRGMLKELISKLGYECILELIESDFLKIIYLDNGAGINTENTNTKFELYSPVVYEISGFKLDEMAKEIFIEHTGKSGKGRRIARRFVRNVDQISIENNIVQKVMTDFTDSNYIKESVINILNYYTPEYPDINKTEFTLNKVGEKLLVSTNIDFRTVNAIYHKKIPNTHSTLTPAFILSHLYNVRNDIEFSTQFEAEIATEQISSEIMNLKYSKVIDSRTKSNKDLKLFQDFTFDHSKAVGNAFSSGHRNCKELIELIKKANMFKNWLKDKDPNAELLKEYFNEVTSGSWIDKLPAKSLRWSIFTGIGLGLDALGAGGIGTTTGLALSAGDAFILDKLIKGWKPNQFVDNELKKFVNK